MSGTYIVKHSDTTVADILVAPLTQDNSTSLTFVGYRFPVYGEALWTNFLHLLENFASSVAPVNPVIGQIWVDTATSPGVPKVYTTQRQWSVIASGLSIGNKPPTPSLDPLTPTAIWFDPTTNSLSYYATPDWIGITCTAYASQIEYNVLITSITAIATAIGITPTAQRVTTTVTSSNVHPTSAQWNSLLTDVITLATHIQSYNSSVTPKLNNTYWDNTIAVLSTHIGENFLWCPAGPDGTGNMHGLSTYDDLLTIIHTTLTNVSVWQSAQLPTAGILQSATISTPTNPTISFASNSTGATSYLWSFGDGTLSTDETPTKTFVIQGTYVITLTVTNAKGHATATSSVLVYAIPITNFQTAGSTTGTAPLPVSFLDTSANTPTSWIWTVTDRAANRIIFTASAQTFQYTFPTIGTYDVTLVAANQAGSGSPHTVPVQVSSAPIARFTRTPTGAVNGTLPFTVQFTDTSSNAPTSWLWDFGDGATSTDRNPSHTYNTIGVFAVSLTATNVSGHDTWIMPAAAATVIPPVASFTYQNATGIAPVAVQFTDTSSNFPTSWLWNFGDGSITSAAQNPSHTYTSGGSFTVSLTVTNASGHNTTTLVDVINTRFSFDITVSQSQTNVVLTTLLQSHGWNGNSPVVGTVTIAPSVVIGASNQTTPALRTGATFPVGSQLALVNNGSIIGAGGNGALLNSAGGFGGPALQFDGDIAVSISLTNNGVIGGGGGGGGTGSAGYASNPDYGSGNLYCAGGGGGGGAGNLAGVGGPVQGTTSGGSYHTYQATAGSSGGSATGGSGGMYGGSDNGADYYTYGGYGGAGGNLGVAGTAGHQEGPTNGGGGGDINDPNSQSHLGAQTGTTNAATWHYTMNATAGGVGGAAVVNTRGFSLPLGTWGTYYGALT